MTQPICVAPPMFFTTSSTDASAMLYRLLMTLGFILVRWSSRDPSGSSTDGGHLRPSAPPLTPEHHVGHVASQMLLAPLELLLGGH